MAYLKGSEQSKNSTKSSIYNKLFKSKPQQSTASKELLTEQFRFKLSKGTKSKLALLSNATNLSQGEIIRQGIEAFSKSVGGKNEIVLGGKIFTKAKQLRARRIK